MKLSKREYEALLDAANRPGGWGLFMKGTTSKLALQGYFERAQHPSYGTQFQITPAGLKALEENEERSS